MKKFLLLMIIGSSLLFSGCVTSYMSYNSSKKEIQSERIVASGNEDAIRNLQMGVNTDKIISAIQMDRGIGLKVSIKPGWTEVLSRHGWRQLGAAVVDAGLLYGAYELVDNSHDNDNRVSNDNSTNVTITGDDNVVNVGDDNDSNGDDDLTINGNDNSSNDLGE